MSKKGKLPTDIKAAARVHTDTMMNVLRGIATNAESPAAARVAAAIYVINRGWGQPQQAIELSGEVVTSKVIRTPAPSTNLTDWQKQYADKPETLQ